MSTLKEVGEALGYAHPIKFAIALHKGTGCGLLTGALAGGPNQELEPTFLAVALDFTQRGSS